MGCNLNLWPQVLLCASNRFAFKYFEIINTLQLFDKIPRILWLNNSHDPFEFKGNLEEADRIKNLEKINWHMISIIKSEYYTIPLPCSYCFSLLIASNLNITEIVVEDSCWAYLFYSEALLHLKFMPDFSAALFCKDDNKLPKFYIWGPGS